MDNKIGIRIASFMLIGLVVVPIVISTSAAIAGSTYCSVKGGIDSVTEKHKAKKEVKRKMEEEGIIELDRQFYVVK